MKYDTNPASRTTPTSDISFHTLDVDSPLLTASFTRSNKTPVYTFVDSQNLIVAEAKGRSKWRKRPTETDADRRLLFETFSSSV